MINPKIGISWEDGDAPPNEIDQGEIAKLLTDFLQALSLPRARVNILLAGDATLHKLNKQFRKIDKPTDVLSWAYHGGNKGSDHPEGVDGLLGEIAVSLERTHAQAIENGWDFHTELIRLLVHGCVHLAGFSHNNHLEETEMRAMEIELLARAGLRDLYPDG